MGNLVLLEVALAAAAILSVFAAWQLSGDELIDKFGPEEVVGGDHETRQKIRQRRGMLAEMTRALVVMVLSILTLLLFDQRMDVVVGYARSKWFGLLIGIPTLVSAVWCCYIAPAKLAAGRSLPARHRLLHLHLAYTMWLPYIVAVYYLMGGVLVVTVVDTSIADLGHLTASVEALRGVEVNDVAGLMRASLTLADFGRWISSASQKYLVVGIMAFVYLIIEQQSNMVSTQWLGNLDLLKVGVGVLFAAVLLLGLIVLPTRYGVEHSAVQQLIDSRALGTASPEDLDRLLEVQKYVDDHSLRWVFVETIAGYGNLLTLTSIGGFLAFQRLFFREIPLGRVAKLILPEFVMKRLSKVGEVLGISGKPASKPEP
ncbi:MAG TPA: hypothetical protein VJK02_17105 [Anaerolineales bacterium]|nr:hypothetical protein [Anaerolineales bacterium]